VDDSVGRGVRVQRRPWREGLATQTVLFGPGESRKREDLTVHMVLGERECALEVELVMMIVNRFCRLGALEHDGM